MINIIYYIYKQNNNSHMIFDYDHVKIKLGVYLMQIFNDLLETDDEHDNFVNVNNVDIDYGNHDFVYENIYEPLMTILIFSIACKIYSK